jgi:hypothetical protein
MRIRISSNGGSPAAKAGPREKLAHLASVLVVAAMVAVVIFLDGTAQVDAVLGLAIATLPITWVLLGYGMPRGNKKIAQLLLDVDAGPPLGAAPVTLASAERWARAVSASDWKAIRELLDERFVAQSQPRDKTSGKRGRTVGRRRYIGSLRMAQALYASYGLTIDEVMSVKGAPEFWVKATVQGRAKDDPDLDSTITSWAKWTLDDSGEQILRMEGAGVVRVT